MNKQKILKAGKIVSQVKSWIKPQIKKDMPLIEIAEKIEAKIVELGGKPAFPVNLSINEIAAHYTPSHDDKTKAHGLLKVDFGVHIDGWTADNAFSIDLENSEENRRIIEASERALQKALVLIKKRMSVGNKSGDEGSGLKLSEIGKIIHETIGSYGFNPIVNLSGHSIEQYNLHSGVTVPNVDNGVNLKLSPGIYAIEPFVTTGNGKVRDGKPSGIYELKNEKNPRSQAARQILEFIKKEYNTLPFCSRWVAKKFGSKGLLGLRELESNGNLHHFAQLVEISKSKVSQAEHTIFIDEHGEVSVTTE